MTDLLALLAQTDQAHSQYIKALGRWIGNRDLRALEAEILYPPRESKMATEQITDELIQECIDRIEAVLVTYEDPQPSSEEKEELRLKAVQARRQLTVPQVREKLRKVEAAPDHKRVYKAIAAACLPKDAPSRAIITVFCYQFWGERAGNSAEKPTPLIEENS